MTIVNVGTTGDYPPFSVWNEEGLSGFDIEVLERFCRDVGYRLKFFKTEWPNLESDLKSGCFDIACGGISLTSVRSKSFLFSGPINRDGKVILVHRDNAKRFTSLSDIDLVGVRVIYNPGGTNEKFAIKNFERAELVCESNIEQIFQRLINKDVHVMVTDWLEGEHRQKNSGGKLVVINSDTPYGATSMAVMATPSGRQLIDKLNKWLQLNETKEFLERLRKKYF